MKQRYFLMRCTSCNAVFAFSMELLEQVGREGPPEKPPLPMKTRMDRLRKGPHRNTPWEKMMHFIFGSIEELHVRNDDGSLRGCGGYGQIGETEVLGLSYVTVGGHEYYGGVDLEDVP